MTGVPVELVEATIALSRERGQDVADIPLPAIAAAVGISRSTLIRRVGGSRHALDDAVRAAGVDPAGRRPVRERAVEAAAGLIDERGLAALTLESVAVRAQCSLPSLHTAVGGRDALLAAVFERYSPLFDLQSLTAHRPERLEDTVRALYRVLAEAFGRSPRVLPALLADLLSRPDGPAKTAMAPVSARLLETVRALLAEEIDARRIRPLPLPLLAQLLVGPIALHMLSRAVIEAALGPALPDVDIASEIFADAFLRAVADNNPSRE